MSTKTTSSSTYVSSSSVSPHQMVSMNLSPSTKRKLDYTGEWDILRSHNRRHPVWSRQVVPATQVEPQVEIDLYPDLVQQEGVLVVLYVNDRPVFTQATDSEEFEVIDCDTLEEQDRASHRWERIVGSADFECINCDEPWDYSDDWVCPTCPYSRVRNTEANVTGFMSELELSQDK